MFAAFLVSGCAAPKSSIPFSDSIPQPVSTRILAGKGESFKFANGNWVRIPSYDYEFTVLQRIYEDGWESIKEVHRRHPEYDGMAGERDQTLHFIVKLSELDGETQGLKVESTLGKGRGFADRSLNYIVIEFTPEISRFAPFNIYRITQKIGEQRVSETIELFKKKSSKEIPFMKMVEEAVIFLPVGPAEQQ